MTISTANENGFETLRLLRVQYGKTKRCTMLSTLMRIMLNVRRLNICKTTPALGVFELAGYERMTAERLPELLKTTLLITRTSGPVYRYLCLLVSDIHTYQKAKTIVVHCRTTTLNSSAQSHGHTTSRSSTTGPAPMEIVAFHQWTAKVEEK